MQKLFLEKIIRAIKKYEMLPKGSRVIVALSGGADSVALLASLAFLRKKYSLTLMSAHLHHGIRGAEADRDAEFSRKISERFDVPFFLDKVDIPAMSSEKGISLELAGRIARYEMFERLASEHRFDRIATGHHLDDQAETVLMRIIRGSGGGGMGGIAPARDGRIIRPLINISKKEILDFLDSEGLPHVEDGTNADSDFFRNRIRNEILPVLESCSPGIRKALVSLGEITGSDSRFIDSYAEELFPEACVPNGGVIRISASKLAACAEAVQRRAVRAAVAALSCDEAEIDFDSTEKARLLISSPSFAKLELRDAIAERRYGDIVFYSKNSVHPEENFVPEMPQELYDGCFEPVSGLSFSLSFSDAVPSCLTDGGMCAVLDADRISMPMRIRFRRDGDSFRPFGMKGKKKLKDFFAGEKIPSEERNKIPIITDSEDRILWIAGMRISADAAVSESSLRFITIKAYRK